MNTILRTIADMICAYGLWGAGRPSNHRAYEEDIPQLIQDVISRQDK